VKLTKPPALKESDVQKLIVDALRLAGLTVLHTSAFKQKGPSGVSKGVPDLLVAHPLLNGCFIGIEVKRPGPIKWSSEEQRLLYETGCTLVAQSPGDALTHVRSAVCMVKEPDIYKKMGIIMRIDNVIKPVGVS
jgi:hypothetical protein